MAPSPDKVATGSSDLEQSINQRCGGGPTKDHHRAEHQQKQKDWSQPPLLGVPKQRPELCEKTTGRAFYLLCEIVSVYFVLLSISHVKFASNNVLSLAAHVEANRTAPGA
jgi:hypothetical protein